MSKISKLIFRPGQFFSDAIRKRIGLNNPTPLKPLERKGSTILKTSSMFNVTRLNLITAPRILLHSGEKQPGEAHMRMWMRSFDEAGVSFAVLTRHPQLYDFVRKTWPHASIALASNAPEVEKIINYLPHLKAVFYTSSTGNNIHLLRFNHLEHVFIGHGDSDKTSSAHKFFRAYDQVWTAGEAHIDRFRNESVDFGHVQFLKVGRPALSRIVKSVDQADAKLRGEMRKRPTILYLPTWEGILEEQNYSSLAISGELLKAASGMGNRSAVLVKIHPMTGRRIAALKRSDSQLLSLLKDDGVVGELIDRSEPLDQHLLRANVFICDTSAVITECLAVDAPIFVYRPQDENLRFTQSAMPPDHFAYVFSSIEEFVEKFELFMKEGDTLAQQRAEARQYLLGIEETRANRFADELRRVAGLAAHGEQTQYDTARLAGGGMTREKQ